MNHNVYELYVMRSSRLKVIHVTTVPETLGFFRGQLEFMKAKGFEVHAISSPGKMLEEAEKRENIPVHPVALTRRISPLSDLIALMKLYFIFRRLRPAIVHAHTPKGGLLGVISAAFARVPIIVYGMRGLPFVSAMGLKKKFLCWSETIACMLADMVIANSLSTKKRATEMGFCPEKKIRVLASGSSNGVDAERRFNPLKLSKDAKEESRQNQQIPQSALVLGYVGRIVRDKGIVELEAAWQDLKNKFPSLYLLLVGAAEPQDPVPPQVMERLETDPRVRLTGRVSDPVILYAAMDVLTLPTYREGFPNTPLEGAAMQLPVVATTTDGCVEAVIDGVTGLLVPPRNSEALAEAIRLLLLNPDMRKTMGQAGRKRVLQDFRPEIIWQALYETYLELLEQKDQGTMINSITTKL